MANTAATGRPARVKSGEKPRLRPGLDYATLLGIFGAFMVISIAVFLGGSIDSFFNLPSVLIVIVGTFLVTTISFTLEEVFRAQGVMFRAALYTSEDPDHAALQVLYLADYARKKGKLGIQHVLKDFRNNPFLYRAILMVVDGLPTEQTEKILYQETEATHARHLRAAGVLRRAGEVAPAMGLIGTLVGLVHMLSNLEDPSKIGPAMAVALLTTFYGAILANMVFTPLATKLERNSEVEAMVNQIYSMGAASISRQENPRRLELMINTILPPSERVNYFDA